MSVSARRRVGASTLAAAALVAVASPAPAAAAPPPYDAVFDAGLACAHFDLGVNFDSQPNTIFREFTDRNGNVVRTINAGKGSDLTFSNASTAVEVSLKGNGFVTRTTLNADGTETVALTGHNVVILFPTDVPAGPTTTLYVGRVVYERSAEGVFTILSTTGESRDICAELG
ncbi:hypothetical protein [Mycetocola sp. 2940]|uniref:hypothetical protein n=1 Tax=Mycetocola sp. 2940 TaxID=3156452 RepID=UPI00339B8F65